MQSSPDRPGAASIIAFISAMWFLLTGWIWGYLACLVIAYPFGLLSLVLYQKDSRVKPSLPLNRITVWILRLGLAVSILSIFMFR
jgi:hypothetical protein